MYLIDEMCVLSMFCHFILIELNYIKFTEENVFKNNYVFKG